MLNQRRFIVAKIHLQLGCVAILNEVIYTRLHDPATGELHEDGLAGLVLFGYLLRHPSVAIATLCLRPSVPGEQGASLDTAIAESSALQSWTSYTSSMSLFSRSKNPRWLDSAHEFCNARDITIVGWGPPALVVEAKSFERAAEISTQLANLGFQAVADPEDRYAGILTLSHPD